MNKPDRPLVAQRFFPFALPVTVNPTPLSSQVSQQTTLDSNYVTIIFTVPIGGLSVLVGDASVNATNGNGFWLFPGVPLIIEAGGDRQLYEVQAPLQDGLNCVPDPVAIPFPVWDVTTIYLASTGNQTVSGWILPQMFV